MQLDSQWVVGFVDGEGCFHVGINANATMIQKRQVLPEFVVVQHIRDINVLYALKNYFQCGVVRVNHGDRMAYRVRGFDHLRHKIIPFFEKHQLKTKKRVDFERFRDIILLMERKMHLTSEGIHKIHQIANQMNRKAYKIVDEPKIESSSY